MNSKLSQLEKIHRGIHRCKKCHGFTDGFIHHDSEKVLRKTFDSSLSSQIFIVAQSLAKNQVRLSGVPFHDTDLHLSRGGKYLEKHFNTLGYTLNPWESSKVYVYTTDLVQCFPGRKPGGKGDNIPVQKEIENCMPWFLKELSLIKPKVILLLGAPSTKAFFKAILEKKVGSIKPLYLKRHRYNAPNGDVSVFVLPHSSSMVKGKSEIFEKTFELIKEELDH